MLSLFQKQQEVQCRESVMRREYEKGVWQKIENLMEPDYVGTSRPWQVVLNQLLTVLKKQLEDFKPRSDI